MEGLPTCQEHAPLDSTFLGSTPSVGIPMPRRTRQIRYGVSVKGAWEGFSLMGLSRGGEGAGGGARKWVKFLENERFSFLNSAIKFSCNSFTTPVYFLGMTKKGRRLVERICAKNQHGDANLLITIVILGHRQRFTPIGVDDTTRQGSIRNRNNRDTKVHAQLWTG